VRVAILGVGLIGGSVGLGARSRCGAHVVGWDPDRGVADQARALKAVDAMAGTLEEAVAGAEVVVVAAPVRALPAAVGAALAAAGPDAAVTDVGSTKQEVVAAHPDPRFVGGHPLAGAETAGVAHARPDLFEDAVWYLTPAETTAGVALERVHRFVAGLGARPRAVDPDRHDEALASVSHLPHVLANVLVGIAAADLDRLPATGPSFRDATRVAGASTAIWRDIYLANSEALIERIDETAERLAAVRAALLAGDGDAIAAWNEAAAADRRKLLEAGLAGGPVCELRVRVPNQPGVVARIALEMGRANLNITDMALYPAEDNRTGSVALWMAGADAERAQALIDGLGFPVVRT
jgi:prephenate dehydrogenase